VALLGKGGMGEVYRADDLVLEQQVALKFLPEALSRNEEALARFRNEVRVARQVSHPNVCRVYDLGEMEGQYCLSMEYVDGEDLGSLLRRIGRLPTDKALEIARKLCAGLAAAHEKGVLHRDLKPANVMLDARGQVLLTDFGLAGLAGEIEGSEVRNGTPAYMAPEQLAGEEVSVKSDIYALGLVLYEIFTGKLPFESTTLAGLIRAQRESAPLSPASLVRDLDPAVERVILRCLQVKPSQRPGSALAVAAALPGGDPLAAALAAGETPSPEMVAAAGEGEGLALSIAIPLLAAIFAGLVLNLVLSYYDSALPRLHTQYGPEVLAQKAKDLVRSLGVTQPPADEFWWFGWDSKAIDNLRKANLPRPNWDEIFARKPPVLRFTYRSARSTMPSLTFHDDLLTPGVVDWDDPPLTESGMIRVVLDPYGTLLRFEKIPEQLQEPLKSPPPVPDWSPLLAAAGLNAAGLHSAEPLWYSLAGGDTRVAWTAEAPRPLRIEAAALRGQPVFFSVIEAGTDPDRMPHASSAKDTVTFLVLAFVVVAVCLGGALVARHNLKHARGDRRGAWRLAFFFACMQMALWLTKGHFTASAGTFGSFLLALCTSVFYGALIWTVYLALEPAVRRRWPQSLISWSTLWIGKIKDPVVGRDVLIGSGLAVVLILIGNLLDAWFRHQGNWAPAAENPILLLGTRGTLAFIMASALHGIREMLFFFFLIFLLRLLLRNQWLAAAVFALLFASLNLFGEHPVLNFLGSFLVLFGFGYTLVRWGLLSLAVCILVSQLLGDIPVTIDTSAWHFANMAIVIVFVLALVAWAFRTAIGGQKLFRGEVV